MSDMGDQKQFEGVGTSHVSVPIVRRSGQGTLELSKSLILDDAEPKTIKRAKKKHAHNKSKILLSPLKLLLPHKIVKTLILGSLGGAASYIGLCALVQMDRIDEMPMSVSCDVDLTQGRMASGSASFVYSKNTGEMVRRDDGFDGNIFGNDVLDPVQAVQACNNAVKDWRYGFEDVRIDIKFGELGSYIDTKDVDATNNWHVVRESLGELADKTDESLYALSGYDSPDIEDDVVSAVGGGIEYILPDLYADGALVLDDISSAVNFLSSGVGFLRGRRGMEMRGYCEIGDVNGVSHAFTTVSDASAIVRGDMAQNAMRVATVPEMLQACYTKALDLGLKADQLSYVYGMYDNTGEVGMFGRRHSDLVSDNSLRSMREMSAVSKQDYESFTGKLSQSWNSAYSLKLRLIG